MPKLLTTAFPWLLVAALTAWLLRSCGETAPGLSAETQTRLNQYEAQRGADSAMRASLLAEAERARQRADSAERVASAARLRAAGLSRDAARAGRLADSLARTEDWQLAYAARTAERDTLLTVVAAQETALAQLDTALAAERARGLTLAEAEANARTRLTQSEDLNRRLRADAERAGRCRIAGLIPCPSRGVAFTAGLVAGAAIVVAAQ